MALVHRAVAHDHGIGAGETGISDIVVLLQLHIRQHTDKHRIFHVDAAADAAGNADPIDALRGHIHRLQQRIDAGVDGALGSNKIVNIHLVDRHFSAGLAFIFKSDHIPPGAVLIPANPVALPDELSPGIDNTGAEQLCDNVNNAATADAHALLPRLAHDGQLRLHGIFVNGDRLHRAIGCPHTAGDVAALKGRTGRTGAGHQKVPVAENDLAVGAQIDEQGHFVHVPHPVGQCAGGDVAAYIGADVGGNDDRRQGVGRQL